MQECSIEEKLTARLRDIVRLKSSKNWESNQVKPETLTLQFSGQLMTQDAALITQNW